MFSEVQYKGYYGKCPDMSLKGDNLEMIKHLIKLCNPEWSLDEGPTARKLMDVGVITIKRGYSKEQYPLFEAIVFKMPPILFSNSQYFLRGSRQYLINPHCNPIKMLYNSVVRYYKGVKKIELTRVAPEFPLDK